MTTLSRSLKFSRLPLFPRETLMRPELSTVMHVREAAQRASDPVGLVRWGGAQSIDLVRDQISRACYLATSSGRSVGTVKLLNLGRHGKWLDDLSSPQRAERSLRLTVPRRRKPRSEEHTSELQSQSNLVCRLLLEK